MTNTFKFTYIYDLEQEPLKICRCCNRVLQPIPTTKKSCSARCRMRNTYERRHQDNDYWKNRTEELELYKEWKKQQSSKNEGD